MESQSLSGTSPWIYVLRGVIGILFGLYMLLAPGIGLLAFVLAYGIFSLIDGIIAAIAAFRGSAERKIDWALLLGGIFGVGVGLFFVFRPVLSIGVLSLVIAFWMIAVGVSAIASAILYRKQMRGEWLLVIAGLFPLGFGIYLQLRPVLAVALLPLMIGGYAIFWGILLLGTGFSLWLRKNRIVDAQARNAT